ncbi:MAG TPA: glycosyltransferase family 4 protein [Candidatus Eisenbacteria bacterium]|jgi:glycosyltransferase involved in cell wall biosynthesis|nr:glycosyltransferase family 4 protein [Candidatus Eisenbacteria bacterium]
MKIAQVAPLHESVPPRLYGGTERVVSYLTEELVSLGHQVTLFASGDSVTAAELIPGSPTALRLNASAGDPIAAHVLLLEKVFQQAHRFDVVHFHCDYLHFPLSRRSRLPNVTTLHGRLDLPDLEPLYREFANLPLVSISNAQRTPIPWAGWRATVYHGLPESAWTPRLDPGGYLAVLGRVSPEKGVDVAIEIARRAGVPLRIAAKVDRADQDYFDAVIRPLLREPGVEFLGEIGEGDKEAFLGGAMALLFPIDWPEPFGLVMIEAMACGTPVIAYRRGSVPEVLDDGATGYVVSDVAQAVTAVERLEAIDRSRVRRVFERRFSARRMARDYLDVYAGIAQPEHPRAYADRS